MFFWSVFLKMHKKSYWPSKTPFLLFLVVNNGFLCVFKNTDQNKICASIVFKAKTKEKYEEKNVFYGYYFKTQKSSFLGLNLFFFFIFSGFSFWKNHTNVILIIIFKNAQKPL